LFLLFPAVVPGNGSSLGSYFDRFRGRPYPQNQVIQRGPAGIVGNYLCGGVEAWRDGFDPHLPSGHVTDHPAAGAIRFGIPRETVRDVLYGDMRPGHTSARWVLDMSP